MLELREWRGGKGVAGVIGWYRWTLKCGGIGWGFMVVGLDGDQAEGVGFAGDVQVRWGVSA